MHLYSRYYIYVKKYMAIDASLSSYLGNISGIDFHCTIRYKHSEIGFNLKL